MTLIFYPQKVLSTYAELYTFSNATKDADAIIILSGNVKTRPEAAAQLYLQKYSKNIFITDAKEEHKKHQDILGSNRQIAMDILKKYSIDVKTIPSVKEGATSTFDEAYDVVEYLKNNSEAKHWNHIIVVTDTFHTSRAHYAFEKIFKQEMITPIQIEFFAAPNNVYTTQNWYTTEMGVSAYLLEPLKYIFYIFHNGNTTIVKEQ
jgi:uncharacterized SAM-binding protein YcdF (DUF218 family)